MKLKLQKFIAPIAAAIMERSRDFDPSTNDGPGESSDPIQQITLGYQFDQSIWVALVFDTRSAAEANCDGQWQSYIEENTLDCDCDIDEWMEAYETLFDEDAESAVTITSVDGVDHVIQPYDDSDDDGEQEEQITNELAELFGTVLRDAMLSARDGGAFANLPVAPTCVLRVDEHEGAYTWPHRDVHGTDSDEGRLTQPGK